MGGLCNNKLLFVTFVFITVDGKIAVWQDLASKWLGFYFLLILFHTTKICQPHDYHL